MNIDADVFAAAQAGEPAALASLLAQVHSDIRRYARRQCHAASALEDVVQEALIVLYRRVGTIRSPQALGAWLVKVVARLCMLPVLTLLQGMEELRTIEDSARFAQLPLDDLRFDVVHALESLPQPYREIILLRDFQEMTIHEIASVLAISRDAAKSRLHRARVLMREFLSADGQA